MPIANRGLAHITHTCPPCQRNGTLQVMLASASLLPVPRQTVLAMQHHLRYMPTYLRAVTG